MSDAPRPLSSQPQPQPLPATSLAQFFELDVEPRRVWLAHELGAILHHQLSVPLEVELGPGGASLGAVEPEAGGARLVTFGDVLHHPRPPVELLEAIKDFAKAGVRDPNGALPSDVATVLYVAAVAVARAVCGRRITHLSDAAVRDNVRWALALPWLDPPTRRLFERTAASLSAGAGAGEGQGGT